MRFAIAFIFLSFLGCAQQPTQQQVAIWSYFLKQCENEGITDRDALAGCITLKERQISSGNGDVLQAMGYTLMQGSRVPLPQSVDCQTTSLIGGYRTVCY